MVSKLVVILLVNGKQTGGGKRDAGARSTTPPLINPKKNKVMKTQIKKLEKVIERIDYKKLSLKRAKKTEELADRIIEKMIELQISELDDLRLKTIKVDDKEEIEKEIANLEEKLAKLESEQPLQKK